MSESTKRTVLLVEDDFNIATATQALLEAAGLEVLSARSGAAAVGELGGNHTVDLVLVGTNLGRGMDGTRTAERILEEKDLPVMFLLKQTESDLVEKAQRVTPYGFAVESSGLDALAASIEKASRFFDLRMYERSRSDELAQLREAVKLEKQLWAEDIDGLPGILYAFRGAHLVRWNSPFEAITNYASNELLGMTVTEFFPTPERPFIAVKIRNVYDEGGAAAEGSFLTKPGMCIPYYFSGNRKEIDGKPGFVGLGIDVSGLMDAREAFRQSDERHQALTRTDPIVISGETAPGERGRSNGGKGRGACPAGLKRPPPGQVPAMWPRPFRIQVLGRFAVHLHGERLTFKGKVQRRPLDLLKALIALGGHQVQEWVLVDALWPDSEGGAGKQALATTLHRLRRIFGNDRVVERQAGALTLSRDLCQVDLWDLDALLDRVFGIAASGEPAPDTAAVPTAEQVLELFAPFLGGEETPEAIQCRRRLKRRVLRALRAWAREQVRHRRFEQAIPIFEGILEIDGLAEDCYRGLMECLVEVGRNAEALAWYCRCRDRLRNSVGTAPAAKTTELYRKIRSTGL
jgi:PAS domain S-box-containing protein